VFQTFSIPVIEMPGISRAFAGDESIPESAGTTQRPHWFCGQMESRERFL
jgi:hypothetical protein